jgi:hypothetical protein
VADGLIETTACMVADHLRTLAEDWRRQRLGQEVPMAEVLVRTRV